MKSNSLTSLLCRLLPTARQWLSVAAVLLLAGIPVAQAQQGDASGQDRRGQTVEPGAQQAAVSQRQALELVRARYPGNVISINEVQQGGGLLYRVRMDNDGNIYTLYVDAGSGDITREQ